MNATNVRQKNVISCTAATTVARASAGSLIDNNGATGSVTVTLGDGTASDQFQPGDILFVDVAAAQAFVIYAGTTGVFISGATTGTAGQSLRQSGTLGSNLELVCIGAGPTFRTRSVVGTFTIS